MMKIEIGEIKSKMMNLKRKSIWTLDELFILVSEILCTDINDIKINIMKNFISL
ncbi:hypothetical protein [Clostridium septicum]|uniref:hypothetical protein n=1 Tax=Clostridium septicum TaxID=1504 RepID=UPI0013E8C222|nr:hypothetical protein [Clostridium septicum]